MEVLCLRLKIINYKSILAHHRKKYMNYYNEIKNELINNEINRKVKNYSINKSDLNTYYNVGKMLSEASKHYGENIVKKYSNKLKIDLNKKCNERTLRRYKQFYNFVTDLKWSVIPTKLSWSHITKLMVKSKEYSRLPIDTRNKIINEDKLKIKDLLPNSILIKIT